MNRRGSAPADTEEFSSDALKILRQASRHISYLLEEGYDLKAAVTFVGNHFLLSKRQRLAIQRSLCTKAQAENRKAKEIEPAQLTGKTVWVDGFNEIITLEVLHCGSVLFEGQDGCIRDLASLHGTYRLIDETQDAIEDLFTVLHRAEKICILLDEPVSNSGRLKTRIAEVAEAMHVKTDIQIVRDVDRVLGTKENVVSSDSVILDRCRSWINVTASLCKCPPLRVFDKPQ
ncbi:MAG: DUF434 domain-containing protein [Catenisphaera adipataccumulans]|jgi:hypothetical protein|uniref:DUF434 domain-containing protein n=1 Tax=Catenisphaera adipataccumulans TaxID=700500 RepID=UPI003D918057